MGWFTTEVNLPTLTIGRTTATMGGITGPFFRTFERPSGSSTKGRDEYRGRDARFGF